MTVRVAVLVSGEGTNLQALIDAERSQTLGAHIALVVSNKANVRALDRARAAGIDTKVIDHRGFERREDFDAVLRDTVLASGATVVVLAGFMRVLTRVFLDNFPSGVLNVHPAILPAFQGMNAIEQALAHGAKLTGCTVHFVDDGVDTGPIVSQSAVEVNDDDTVASLRARVSEREHLLLPAAVRALAMGELVRDGRRVVRRR